MVLIIIISIFNYLQNKLPVPPPPVTVKSEAGSDTENKTDGQIKTEEGKS